MVVKFSMGSKLALAVICVFVVVGLLTVRFGESMYTVGESMEELPGVDYGRAARTLVLSIHSTCGFCTASMPFYRKILEQRTVRSAASVLQVVAVSREDRTVSGNYLGEHGVYPDEVVAATLRSSRTPTLVLVDRSSRILAAWGGQVSGAVEDEVLGLLFGPGK